MTAKELANELKHLMDDIPERAEMSGREFRRMVQAVVDKCGDALPQGLVEELRYWKDLPDHEEVISPSHWEKLDEILSRYEVPATDRAGEVITGRCGDCAKWMTDKCPSESNHNGHRLGPSCKDWTGADCFTPINTPAPVESGLREALKKISELEIKCSNAWAGGNGTADLSDLEEIGKIARTILTLYRKEGE